MSPAQIKQIVIEVLTQIQELSGRDVPEITDQTQPIGDLPGFDSLSAEEATIALSDRLGHQIEGNPFFPEGKGRPPKVSQIVRRLVRLLADESASVGA